MTGHGGTVTINNIQSNGGAHWVALYYANGDSTWRNVTVRSVEIPSSKAEYTPHPHILYHLSTPTQYSVNSGATTLVQQPDTGGGHVILSVPIEVNLNNGANSITFGSGQSSAFAFPYRRILLSVGRFAPPGF